MRALVLTLALGAAAIAAMTNVFAADKSILGQDAPAISTKEFRNSDGRTSVADFKGEVLFIECFATW
jgi:hypothetical protein